MKLKDLTLQQIHNLAQKYKVLNHLDLTKVEVIKALIPLIIVKNLNRIRK